jgi:hypothetical protein
MKLRNTYRILDLVDRMRSFLLRLLFHHRIRLSRNLTVSENSKGKRYYLYLYWEMKMSRVRVECILLPCSWR